MVAIAPEAGADVVAAAAAGGALALDALDGWVGWVGTPGTARPGPLGFAVSAAVALAALIQTRLRWRIVAVAVVGGILTWAPPAAVRPLPPRIVFLDVGWGDAVLIQTGAATVLVDAGPRYHQGDDDAGRAVVLPALAALGVRELDVVIVSHADRDHRGGVPSVLRGLPVGALWLPLGGSRDAGFDEVLAVARERGVPVFERGARDPGVRFGDVALEVLWPESGRGRADNAASLVVRAHVAGVRVLLTGDLERAGEIALVESGRDLRADLLKLGHHGSRTSSSDRFLDAVRPELAVASAPARGRLAFPHATVLARLERRGIPWAWTGRDGAVLVALPGLGARGWKAGRLGERETSDTTR